MIAIPTLFWKLQNVKNLVRTLSKKHRSRTPFDSQHVKESQTLVNICMRALSSYSLITMGDPDFENISLNDMLNLRGVS